MCADEMVQDWVGLPYLLHGRDRRGVDCVGLVYAIFAEKGIRLPGSRIPKSNITDLLNLLRGEFAVVHDESQPLDIILLHLSGTSVLHCGVCVGNNQFVHVMGQGGVKCENVTRWRPQVIKTYRYRGMICQKQ